MIAEGSCDTEDGCLKIKICLNRKPRPILNCSNISQYDRFYYFWSNKCSLGKNRVRLFDEMSFKKKNVLPQTLVQHVYSMSSGSICI